MATCPKCGGDLSEDHRCVGAWRRITRAIGDGIAGRVFGAPVVMALGEHASKSLLTVAGLLGGVVVSALWRASGF
jgi:hypothetical protein